MKQLNTQRIGIFAVLLLGLGLLVARGAPNMSGPLPNGSTILSQIQLKQDHVEPMALAKRIVEGKNDFALIDTRQPWEFDDYHIPGAVNVPLEQLLTDAGRAQLPKQKEIILYSSGGTHAAQAWVVLAASDYKVKTVLDGLQGWWRDVITPVSLKITDETKDAQEYKERKSIREYFLGTGAPAGKPAPAISGSTPAPKTVAPAGTPTESSPSAPGKSKGGGC